MYTYELRIPKERIAMLLGKKGEVKKRLEKELGVKIIVDSEEGDVLIKGEDNINLFLAEKIIKAIGRGFSPKNAELLLNEDNAFEFLNIEGHVGRNKNRVIRMRGRIIGERGKSRRNIENLTETKISVYGKTIGIIGGFGEVAMARRAVEMLLRGSNHSTVYLWLERERKKLRESKILAGKA